LCNKVAERGASACIRFHRCLVLSCAEIYLFIENIFLRGGQTTTRKRKINPSCVVAILGAVFSVLKE